MVVKPDFPVETVVFLQVIFEQALDKLFGRVIRTWQVQYALRQF